MSNIVPNQTSKSGYWKGNNWVNTTTAPTPPANFYIPTSNTSTPTWSTVSQMQQQTIRWIEVCSCGSEKVVAECLVCHHDLCFGCFITHYADRHAQEALEKYEETSRAL